MSFLRPRIRLVALVVAFGISACTNTPAASTAASVDGGEITDAQVRRIEPALDLLTQLAGQSCAPASAGAATAAPPPSTTADCNRRALELLITAQLVKGYASEHKVSVSASEINDALTQIGDQSGGKTEFDKKLADGGVSVQAFREFLQSLILLQDVQNAFDAGQTEQDLQALYEQNKSQFTMIDTSHILLKTSEVAQKLKDEATPANFAQLARKFSQDPGTAKQGGALGPVAAVNLVPEYSNAVLAAKPGEIIGPVQSQFGYHVIWVKKITVQPFDKVKDQLAQNAAGLGFQKWISDHMKSASIKVNPRYGIFDPSSGEIKAAGSPAPPAEAASPSP